MTDEETKRILEFAGFSPFMGRIKSPYILWWENEAGNTLPANHNVTSLDWLFEWVVPKLWYCKMDMVDGEFFVWDVGHPDIGKEPCYRGPAEEDAGEALYRAILKMLEEK